MITIGEKINGSIPAVAKAIAGRDAEFIKQRAIAQENAGAIFIDCCASVPESEEVETLRWMIDCIQEVTDLPIAVDSPSADVLAQTYKGIIAFSPLAPGLLTDRYLKGIPADSRIMTNGRFLQENALTQERLNRIRKLNDLALIDHTDSQLGSI